MMTKDTLLHRQVHPTWIQHDKISLQVFATSLTFQPSLKDEGQLSVYNGDKFTAESSYNHFIGEGYPSAGVLSISCTEVDTVGNLSSHENNYPFDGHCYIDFNNNLSNAANKKKSQKLRDIAMLRGWTHKI